MTGTSQPRSVWGYARGDEIVPHRTMQALLGGGERFEAYAVWNHRLMRPSVVKMLRPAIVDNRRARRQLAREGELLSGLQHPGLTRLFAMDADRDRPFIEIEYVQGPRLSTLIRRHGPLNLGQVFRFGRQLAATLHFLHDQGIVHLDVKPSNVIMGPTPRLIDLSVARTIERAARINGYVGTDAYMSPEQADPGGWSVIGPKSDTWGLGATLYYAVAERIPHPKGRREATGSERFPQLIQSPALLDAQPHASGLVEVIMDAMRRSPDDRPTVAQVFDRLDHLAAGAGVR